MPGGSGRNRRMVLLTLWRRRRRPGDPARKDVAGEGRKRTGLTGQLHPSPAGQKVSESPAWSRRGRSCSSGAALTPPSRRGGAERGLKRWMGIRPFNRGKRRGDRRFRHQRQRALFLPCLEKRRGPCRAAAPGRCPDERGSPRRALSAGEAERQTDFWRRRGRPGDQQARSAASPRTLLACQRLPAGNAVWVGIRPLPGLSGRYRRLRHERWRRIERCWPVSVFWRPRSAVSLPRPSVASSIGL